jgi:hypothetical protein
MYHSYFDATPYYLLKDRSHSYYVENGKRTEARFDVNTGITVSNSGLNSPISDMVKYLNFLIGVSEPPASAGGQEGEKRSTQYDEVLKRSSLEEMWKPQLPTTVDSNGNRGFTTDIGLIFFVNRVGDRIFYGHGGDQNGFLSYIDFEPATRQGSIIVFNTNVSYPEGTPPEKDVVARLRNEVRKLY